MKKAHVKAIATKKGPRVRLAPVCQVVMFTPDESRELAEELLQAAGEAEGLE